MTRFRTALLASVALSCASVPASAQSPATPPRPDPPLGEVVDSARLAAALRGAAPRPAGTRIPSDFDVHFAADGSVESIRPAFRKLPADYAAALAELIRPTVRPQAPRAEGWSFTVRAEGGQAVTLEKPVYAEIPPDFVNRRQITNEMGQVARSLPPSRLGDRNAEYNAAVLLIVNDEGVPERVVLLRGTGDVKVDERLHRVAQRMRFRPAVVDGIPVPALAILPINMVVPPPPRPASPAPDPGFPSLPRIEIVPHSPPPA